MLEDDELVDMIADQAVERINADVSSSQTQIGMIEREIQKLSEEGEGLVKNMVNLDSKAIKEFVSPRLNEISEQKQALESNKIKIEQQIAELQEENASPEDIRYMVSSITKEFEDLTDLQKQRLLGMLVSKVELHEGKVKVFLRTSNNPTDDDPDDGEDGDKKKSPQTNPVRDELRLAPLNLQKTEPSAPPFDFPLSAEK